MRLLAVILLSGCATTPTPETPPPTAPESELHAAWEREVDDAVAGFTAVRPRLTSTESAVLALFDAQLKGLEALAGSPTLQAVEAKATLLGPGSESAIARLLAQKAALDAKTTLLESKVVQADKARLEAEQRAKTASQQAIQAEAASNLSRVATLAILAGIAAFLFGHYLAIPKWVAASTVGLGVLTATTAPQLLAFFGSDSAQYLMLATLSAFALGAIVTAALWAYRRLRPLPPCADVPKEDKGG